LAQKFQRRCSIVDGLVDVETLIKLKRLLPLSLALIRQFNTGLLAPEQIRANRHEPARRVPVGNDAQKLVDAKNFLQDDNARSVTARGQSEIRIELTAVRRFNFDHFASAPARSFIREVMFARNA